MSGVGDDDLERLRRRRRGSGSRYVPPQPGIRPRKHSGSATAGDAGRDRPVGAVQGQLEAAAERRAVDEREATGRPARRAAEDACPTRPIARASSRLAAAPTMVRSAPAAKMNGLPVTPTATISPAAARAATPSSAAFEAGQTGRAERRRAGVVAPVVEGDQRQSSPPAPRGRCDVADAAHCGDDLRSGGAAGEPRGLDRGAHAAGRSSCP